MDYYKDLKRDDFASDDDYLVERVQRGLAAGFTLALGLSQAEILTLVGPDTGYLFPHECTQTST